MPSKSSQIRPPFLLHAGEYRQAGRRARAYVLSSPEIRTQYANAACICARRRTHVRTGMHDCARADTHILHAHAYRRNGGGAGGKRDRAGRHTNRCRDKSIGRRRKCLTDEFFDTQRCRRRDCSFYIDTETHANFQNACEPVDVQNFACEATVLPIHQPTPKRLQAYAMQMCILDSAF